MSNRARVVAVAVIGVLLALAAMPAGAGAFNHAKFDIVIEGLSTAKRTFSLTGQASICEESLHGTFEEHSKFQRGKGVTIEVVRKKKGSETEFGVKRLGGSPAITLVTKSWRTATGEQSLKRATNAPIPVQCPEEGVKDLSKIGSCSVTKTTRDNVGMHVNGNLFTIAQDDQLTPPTPTTGLCGETPLDKGFIKMFYEWPDYFPPKEEPIPEAKLFSGLKAVRVDFYGDAPPHTEKVGTYPLTGEATDEDGVIMIVRFIRCGVKHYPAC
jgi:hypothetical protein